MKLLQVTVFDLACLAWFFYFLVMSAIKIATYPLEMEKLRLEILNSKLRFLSSKLDAVKASSEKGELIDEIDRETS